MMDENMTKEGLDFIAQLQDMTNEDLMKVDIKDIRDQRRIALIDKPLTECYTTSELLEVFFAQKGYEMALASITSKTRRGKVKKNKIQYIRALFSEWCTYQGVASNLSTDNAFDKAITILREEWLEEERELLIDKFSIQLPKGRKEELWNELQEVTGWNDNDIIILKAWMANVLNILNDEKSTQVPSPVLYATDQSIGKSYFTRCLGEAFNSMYQVIDVDQIGDNFSKPLFENLLIGDLDEMAGADRSDMNSLKKFATSDSLIGRAMHSQNIDEITKRTQLLGSSNKSIREIIADTTGSRRFWEIVCLKVIADWLNGFSKDKEENDRLRRLWFMELWQSIDENDLKVFKENEKRLLNITFNEQRRTSNIEDFVKEYINSKDFEIKVKCTDLYKKYQDFCTVNGIDKKFVFENKYFLDSLTTKGNMKKFISRKKTNGNYHYIFDTESEYFTVLLEEDHEDLPY